MTATAANAGWVRVGSGTTGGVSGLAPAPSGWVFVHDNKKAGQNRVSLLSDAGVVTPLTWPGASPNDLESIAAVPASSGEYVAVTSTGQATRIGIMGNQLAILNTFTLPRGKSGIESFALTQDGSTTIAVWATRGSTTGVGRVWASTLVPSSGVFGKIVTGTVKVPYPATSVRQLADLMIQGGRLVGSATSDPGVSGPFASALYDLGSVSLVSGKASLHLTTPDELVRDGSHKVEGIACSGSVGLLGSDDEKLGGWTAGAPICT